MSKSSFVTLFAASALLATTTAFSQDNSGDVQILFKEIPPELLENSQNPSSTPLQDRPDSALVREMDNYQVFLLEQNIYRIMKGRMSRNPELAKISYGLSEDEMADLFVVIAQMQEDSSALAKTKVDTMCANWRDEEGVYPDEDRATRALDFYDYYEVADTQISAIRDTMNSRIASRMGQEGVQKVANVVQNHKASLASRSSTSWSDMVRSVGREVEQLEDTCSGEKS
tara:strand:+ start:80 stop:763 length:684 start_codon:yes stop_codon:yes gene_type:complete